MTLCFYSIHQSTVPPPIINTIHSYDDISSKIVFTGSYPVNNTDLPQYYMAVQENRQYPFLAKITKKEEINTQKLCLYFEIIKEIKTEEEFKTYTET